MAGPVQPAFGRESALMTERRIDDRREILPLLAACGLSLAQEADDTVGIYDEEGELAATGSLCGDMLQMIAVSPRHQGEDLAARVLTWLVNRAVEKGLSSLYLFTKPEKTTQFLALGFRKAAVARPHAALLEWGSGGIGLYCEALRQTAAGYGNPEAAAVVMNCNPFTLGHQYLVETAAAREKRVYLLAVEEEKSEFPFSERLLMIRRGVARLPNVTVLSGGRYVVSSLTFPSYFTRETELAKAHCSIDLELFVRQIAPALGVRRRYVGTEPLSPVTSVYNQTMKELLPPAGIEVVEVPRIEVLGAPVSASRVRALIGAGDWDAVRELVPATTLAHLRSPACEQAVRRLWEAARRGKGQ